jgi:hypothetical protein
VEFCRQPEETMIPARRAREIMSSGTDLGMANSVMKNE